MGGLTLAEGDAPFRPLISQSRRSQARFFFYTTRIHSARTGSRLREPTVKVPAGIIRAAARSWHDLTTGSRASDGGCASPAQAAPTHTPRRGPSPPAVRGAARRCCPIPASKAAAPRYQTRARRVGEGGECMCPGAFGPSGASNFLAWWLWRV